MQKILLTVCSLACAVPALAFRPPAVPLVTVDPFFSVWSAADRLTDVETTHWAGAKQPITVLLEADGRTWRLCGATPADVPALPQVATEVRPTQTVCTFAEGALRVELRFATAKLPDDLEVFSRPVTYVTARVQGAKAWRLLPSISPALATNDDAAPMVTNRTEVAGLPAMSIGRRDQTPLGESGDRVRCDWGYAWLVGPSAPAAGEARPVVGVLSAIPGVLGEQMNPMMMQMRRRPSPGWVAFSELKKDYDLREIAKDAESIDPDVKALVVIHPKDLSEKTLFAIDQFVIKGGRLIACVDPFSFKDFEASSQQQQNPMMQMGGQGGPSTLGKLFEKWGISFDTSKCVADDKAAVQMRGRNGAVVTDATVLELGKANIAKDVLTAGISQLIIPYAGALEFTPSEGLEFTPILTSSTNNACLVDASMLQMGPEAIRGQIKPDGVRRTLAGRLTGTFKTAFPKGPDWKEGSTNAVPTVVESGKGFVFLFADADFLSNEACVEMVNTLFGQQAVLRGDNLSLFSNIIEQFAGREELIGLRSRGPSDRPFEVVRNLRAEAEKKFRAKAEELQAKLNETSKKLNELLQGKRGTDRQLVSQELESAIGEARREKAKTQKELKNVRKELNADIENLGFRLKVVNICLVPLLVILFGIFRAVLRRKR